MLYVDIPSLADLKSLAAHRDDICVSIYLPTTPVSQETAGDRIELKNLAKEALRQLETANTDKRRVAALMEHLDDLVDDDEFWRFQARSLAVLATPDNARTFRVPNALVTIVEVSDRFHLKPLLRAIAFPNTCFVLALAENALRVIQVSADLSPLIVKVDGMPKDAGSAVGRASVNDRSPSGRIQGSEGQKVLLRQFARKIDQALRGLLTGSDIPLVLAASEPLVSIYRSVNTYTHLAKAGIDGSPVHSTDAQLADRARALLDGLYRDEIAQWKTAFAARGLLIVALAALALQIPASARADEAPPNFLKTNKKFLEAFRQPIAKPITPPRLLAALDEVLSSVEARDLTAA